MKFSENWLRQHVRTEIGVLDVLARRREERGRDHRRARLFGGRRDAPQVAARGQARAVLEQHADGDVVLRAAAELRDVLNDAVVEAELPFVEQDHDGGRRADHLRERGEIVDRALRDDRAGIARPCESAEALLPDGGALAPDDDRGARIAAGANAALDDAVDVRQPRRRHADGARCLGGQTITRRQRHRWGQRREKARGSEQQLEQRSAPRGTDEIDHAITCLVRQNACSTICNFDWAWWDCLGPTSFILCDLAHSSMVTMRRAIITPS